MIFPLLDKKSEIPIKSVISAEVKKGDHETLSSITSKHAGTTILIPKIQRINPFIIKTGCHIF